MLVNGKNKPTLQGVAVVIGVRVRARGKDIYKKINLLEVAAKGIKRLMHISSNHRLV